MHPFFLFFFFFIPALSLIRPYWLLWLQIQFIPSDSWVCRPSPIICRAMSKANCSIRSRTLRIRCTTWFTVLWTTMCTISSRLCSRRSWSRKTSFLDNRYVLDGELNVIPKSRSNFAKLSFSLQTYTDEDHGIVQSRAHLYHSLENFLDECFQPSSWSEHGIVMTI